MKKICVLKVGKEYSVRHAQWLARQVPDLICISNVDVPTVPTLKMLVPWESWWCKMNMFNPDLIQDDLLYIDLDTVVLGDLNQFEMKKSTMLSDFYRPQLPGSGFMFIKHEDKRAVWTEWLKNPDRHMKRCVTREHWGDQGFLRDVLPHQRWQTVCPDKVVSFKVHCQKKLPEGADVVCFHGNPRPWQVGKHWVPRLA